MKNRILLIIFVLLISGCAWGTRRPFLTYAPISTPQPKNNIEVKVNSFKDKRTITDTVGYSRNGFGMRCAKVVPENSVTEWITDALKAELINAGYTISDNETTVNIIEGAVFDIFCDTYFTYDGKVVLKLVLKKDGKVALDKNYSASKTGGVNWAATSSSFAKTLELTLQDVLQQVMFDINDKLISR